MAQNPYSGGTPTVPAEVDQPVDPLQRINVSPDMFGAQVGRGLSVVGGSLSDLSQIWGEVQGDAATNNAMTQLGSTLDQYKTLNGQDALNARQATLSSIDAIIQKNRQNVPLRQQPSFDEAVRRRANSAHEEISRWAGEQGRNYARETNEASRNLFLAGVANSAFDDPMTALKFREDARNAAAKQADLVAGNQADPVVRENAIREADQASALAFIGGIEAKDPVMALKVANEPQFKKDLGVEYNPTIQRLQGKAEQAAGHGASAPAIAKAQNDANAAAAIGQSQPGAQQPPLPGEQARAPQAPGVAPTQVEDPNSTQAMMAAAIKNVTDDPSLSDRAKAVAFDDIKRWGAERDLADEQNKKAQEARTAKVQDHVFNLLNQGDFIGASRQADADAAAGNISQHELFTLRETIQKQAKDNDKNSFSPMYHEMLGRMLLPEGSPNRVRTNREILEAYNAGQLTLADKDELVKNLSQIDKGEGGESLMVNSALAMARRHLSYEVDYGYAKIPDLKGEDYINKFTQQFVTSLRDWKAKNNPLEKFPLFDNGEILKAVNQIRPPSQRERDFIDAEHQTVGETTGGTPPAQIPPPQGIDGDGWINVVSAPPMLQTGQRMTTDLWAKAVSKLAANPDPRTIAAFDAWFPGQSGQGILDILGTKAQAPQPEAAQPEFAPSNLAPPAPPIANVRAQNLQEQHAPSPKRGPEIRYETPVPDEGAAARQRQYMETHEPAPSAPPKPENVRTRRLREQHEKEGQ